MKEIKMEHQAKKKKKLLSTKKKNYLKLLASNPTRDENPKDLKDLQINRVQETVKRNIVLSRGQRKRLQKKEKFINQQLLEEKSIETFKLLNEKKKAMTQAKQKVMDSSKMDVDMSGADAKKSKPVPPKPSFGDFAGMNSLLDQIKTSVEKKELHSKSHQNIKKQRAVEAQQEKERLQKIMGLQSFQASPLDNLYQHINNSINQKIKDGSHP